MGAGAAGCVLANRLTEDPATRALLIEAGGRDLSPHIKIPAAFAKQFHTKLDWDFSTEPEPRVDGRSLYVPRGKSLGGSSSMNAMLYVRGRPLRVSNQRSPRAEVDRRLIAASEAPTFREAATTTVPSRRGDVPGQPARRPALERRGRLPAPRAQTAEARGDDGHAGPPRRIRG